MIRDFIMKPSLDNSDRHHIPPPTIRNSSNLDELCWWFYERTGIRTSGPPSRLRPCLQFSFDCIELQLWMVTPVFDKTLHSTSLRRHSMPPTLQWSISTDMTELLMSCMQSVWALSKAVPWESTQVAMMRSWQKVCHYPKRTFDGSWCAVISRNMRWAASNPLKVRANVSHSRMYYIECYTVVEEDEDAHFTVVNKSEHCCCTRWQLLFLWSGMADEMRNEMANFHVGWYWFIALPTVASGQWVL